MRANHDAEVALPDQATHATHATLLACMTCQTQQSLELSPENSTELVRDGLLRLACPSCRTVTFWHGLQADRRSGSDRRASHHARIQLPIRVRCSLAGSELTELATTITASRHGASFISTHGLCEGTRVQVLMPYSEGDPVQLEMPAKVVRVEPKGGVAEIGIQFLVGAAGQGTAVPNS